MGYTGEVLMQYKKLMVILWICLSLLACSGDKQKVAAKKVEKTNEKLFVVKTEKKTSPLYFKGVIEPIAKKFVMILNQNI